MIVSFRHKGLRKFFETGSLAGIKPDHAPRLGILLNALEIANVPEDMNNPNFGFHLLRDLTRPRWAIEVNANWRMTFELKQGNALVVDYEDYH